MNERVVKNPNFNLDDVVSLRTETSKTYDLGKGRYGVHSSGVMHYKDNYNNLSEAWKNIDLTFVNNRIDRAPYILEVDKDKRAFIITDKRTGAITTIEIITIGGLPCAVSSPVIVNGKKRSTVSWVGVAVDTDLVIEASNHAVRFKRILHSNKAPQQATFKVKGETKNLKVSARSADGEGIEVDSVLAGNILSETISFVGAKFPVEIDPTVDVSIAAGADDDGYKTDPTVTWVAVDTNLKIGYLNQFGTNWGASMRFTGVNIPDGVTITVAYVTVVADITRDETVVNSKLALENSNNPGQHADGPDYIGRALTTQIDYDGVPTWTEGVSYNSSSLVAAVQQVVDENSGTGDAVIVRWDDHDSRSDQENNHYRRFASFENETYDEPSLYVEYTPAYSPASRSANMGSKMVAAGLI